MATFCARCSLPLLALALLLTLRLALALLLLPSPRRTAKPKPRVTRSATLPSLLTLPLSVPPLAAVRPMLIGSVFWSGSQSTVQRSTVSHAALCLRA
jgi:hypothetical protein